MKGRIGILGAIVVSVLFAGVLVRSPASSALTGLDTPCVSASPDHAGGTPVAGIVTPVADCLNGPLVSLGTPISTEGLTIEVRISSQKAGPVTVTVTIAGANGDAVTDAAVTVTQRHLEMDMGARSHDAAATAPGVYVAENLAMGMGGDWRVEIDVDRPGRPRVVAYLLVALQGPM